MVEAASLLRRGTLPPAAFEIDARRPYARGVSAWRREALKAFPELRTELNDKEEMFSVYALWFELLPRVEEAHREEDEDLLRRIYGYAEWCFRQGGDLENAVAVAFYEHLFDERWMRPLVPRWVKPEIVTSVWPLWELRLSDGDFREVRRLLRRKGIRRALR